MQKKIIFFDANQSVVPAIQYAKSRGLYVITCDNKENNAGHALADESHLISTLDTDTIMKFVATNKVDAVVYFASGPGAFAGCRIIEKYGLPGIPNTTRETLSFKNNFRNFLSQNGFTSYPKYITLSSNSIPESINQLDFPVIVKPTDRGGNNGITKVIDKAHLQEAIDTAYQISNSGNVIIEEFIETNLQINGDCIVENGDLKLVFLGKHLYSSHSDILPYSTIFGKGVIPSEIEGRVIQEIQKIIDATKIKNGALNVEFRVSKNGKVNFIEVNSRHSGNYIYKLMNYAYGVSLEEIAVKLALGESLNIDNKKQTGFFAYALLFSKSAGEFEGVSISEEIKPFVKEQFIFKEKGNAVSIFKKLTDRIGLLLLEFPSLKTMETVTNNFHNYYSIELSKKQTE